MVMTRGNDAEMTQDTASCGSVVSHTSVMQRLSDSSDSRRKWADGTGPAGLRGAASILEDVQGDTFRLADALPPDYGVGDYSLHHWQRSDRDDLSTRDT